VQQCRKPRGIMNLRMDLEKKLQERVNM